MLAVTPVKQGLILPFTGVWPESMTYPFKPQFTHLHSRDQSGPSSQGPPRFSYFNTSLTRELIRNAGSPAHPGPRDGTPRQAGHLHCKEPSRGLLMPAQVGEPLHESIAYILL